MEYTDALLFGTLGGMFLLSSVIGIMFIVEIASKYSKGEFYAVDRNIIWIACIYNMLAVVAVLFIKKEKQLVLGTLIINLDILLVVTLIAVTFVK